MSVTRKRKLYVDGNTVYGIDEECLKRKESAQTETKEQREVENYMTVLMNLFYFK